MELPEKVTKYIELCQHRPSAARRQNVAVRSRVGRRLIEDRIDTLEYISTEFGKCHECEAYGILMEYDPIAIAAIATGQNANEVTDCYAADLCIECHPQPLYWDGVHAGFTLTEAEHKAVETALD
jgi:hypothetical protein